MFPVAEGAGEAGNTGYASFAVTDGTLGYSAGAVELRELVWVDRSGETLGVASSAAPIQSFALSPSGEHVAFERRHAIAGRGDIWLQELPGDSPFPVTFGSGAGWGKPAWSPNGREIAFATFDRAGLPTYEIRRKASDLSGEDMLVAAQTEALQVCQWSPDGQSILYTNSWTGGDLWLLAVDGSGDRHLVAGGPGSPGTGQFSPDGRWIAYGSDQNGETQVYIQPYPTTGAVWQISLAGGDMPRWRADGKELFYRAADGQLMALPVVVTATAARTRYSSMALRGRCLARCQGRRATSRGLATPRRPMVSAS